VLNEWQATARILKVELDDGPLLAHPLILRGQEEVTKLGSSASARYLLAPTMGSTMKVDARVTWDDDSGDRRSWESQLKL
jgi:hypothetical protein